MKFKTKIIISYLITLAALIILTFVVVKMSLSSKANAEFLRTKVTVSVSEAKQIQLDIVQIQQWLTDASATGYMDGFDLAEEYFNDANKLLDRDIARENKLGKTDLEKKLKEIKVQLKDYYDVGKEMAHTYIDNGRDAGNIWMDKFDPEAEKLTAMIDKQIEGYNKVYESKFIELNRYQSLSIQVVLIMALFVVLLLLAMGFYVAVSFNKGIKLITDYSDKLSANDISDSKSIKRKDEFGKTASQFKNSFKLLNDLVSGIKKSTDTTANVKDSLSASTEETSATIVNIKNSTVSLLSESEKMNKNVTDNVTAIEEINANLGSINNQINDQASMVEESTASITEMISSIENVNNITNKKSEAINQLVNVVDTGANTLSGMTEGFRVGVVEKIEGISAMASTIQQIASQTNLLSMNAAIEAAHAGDAGKGFAVVAEEIRKLADTSSQSSTSITRIIKEISDGVTETELKTKQSSEAFDVINKEIKETRQAFDEISSSTAELNVGGKQILDAMSVLQDVTISVKGASEEMAIGYEQIVRGQLELKDISQRVNRGMQEINSGSKEIVIASDEIVGYSSELNSVVNDLKEETDKFKI